jgi:hypothetical protein
VVEDGDVDRALESIERGIEAEMAKSSGHNLDTLGDPPEIEKHMQAGQTSGSARESNPPGARFHEAPSVLKTEPDTSPGGASTPTGNTSRCGSENGGGR